MPDSAGRIEPASLDLPSFSRLLLVTDFSPPSRAAAPIAALIAEYYRSSVVVAHVIAPEHEESATTQSAGGVEKTVAGQLKEFIASTTLGECNCETVVAHGSVWEVLAAIVAQKQIGLIVLGTHGRSGVGKLLLGSVAQRIFSLAPCPVLSVSPRAGTTWGPGHKLTRIIYATDFSPESVKALPYALSLAKVSGAELVLLHAPESAEPLPSEIVMGYQQHLTAMIPPEDKSWCSSDTLVTPGEPARAIVDAAASHSADLIVIGAKAYTGSLSHFQVPVSIAYRVVAHAPCPVLRVRT